MFLNLLVISSFSFLALSTSVKEATFSFDDAEPGDLAFFGNEGKVSHVGLVAENGRILHVSGYLHFDKLQPEGIWNEQLQDYSHYMIGIRRFF